MTDHSSSSPSAAPAPAATASDAPSSTSASAAMETSATPAGTAGTPPSGTASSAHDAAVLAALDAMGELSEAQMAQIDRGDFSALDASGTDMQNQPQQQTPDAMAAAPATTTEPKSAERVHRLSLGGLPPETRARFVQLKTLIAGGKSEHEAYAEVFGMPPAAMSETSTPGNTEAYLEPHTAAAMPTTPPAIQNIEDQITAKEAEIEQVESEYGNTGKLLRELQKLEVELHFARRDHAAAEATREVFQAEVNHSYHRAVAEHAELWSDPRSNFESLCDDEFVLASHKNDPVLREPDWPEKIASRVKDKFFKRYDVHNAGDDDEDPAIPPLPHQAVRLPGSLTGATAAPGSFTPGNAIATFDSLSDAEQEAVLMQAERKTRK